MVKRIAWLIFIIVLLTGVVLGGKIGYGKFVLLKRYSFLFVEMPAVVSSSRSIQQTWSPDLSAVGSLIAVNGVDIKPELPGIISEIRFMPGQLVEAGKSLIQIDDAVEQAQLSSAKANLTLSKVEYTRMREVYQKAAGTSADLDKASAQFQQAAAEVARMQAMIAKKNIVAPFTGKVGIRRVNIGEYVQSGTLLVTLQAMDPLYLEFYLPEQQLHRISLGQVVTARVDSYPNQTFTGKIDAINTKVDLHTRNLLIQATIKNPEGKLLPGMFAYISVTLPESRTDVMVPQTAITHSMQGDLVYVIRTEPDPQNPGKNIKRTYERSVDVGPRVGNNVVIEKGLAADEEIVTVGQMKLYDGCAVQIDNSVPL